MKRRFIVIQGGLAGTEKAASGQPVDRRFTVVDNVAAPLPAPPVQATLEATAAALRERLAALNAQLDMASAALDLGRRSTQSRRAEAQAVRGPIPPQAFLGVRPDGWETTGSGHFLQV